MSAEGFISSRFNRIRGMPRSLKMMTIVSMAGVAVATASLVVAASIGAGFERQYKRALLDFNAHVIVSAAGEISSPKDAIEELYRMPDGLEGVVSAHPFLYREAMLVGPAGIRGVIIKGMELGDPAALGGMKIEMEDGFEIDALPEPSEGSIAVIAGSSLAAGLKTDDGSAASLMIPGREGRHRFASVLHAGSFESGMHGYDADFLLADIDSARRLFAAGEETASGIELRLADPDRAAAVSAAINERLGPRYSATSWEELNYDLLAAVRLERLVSAVIMGIMLIVAALNIVAVLVLTTIRRMNEIALLKAVGLSNGAVARIFVRGGFKVGMTGAVAGMAVGIALAAVTGRYGLVPLEAEIYMIDSLPIDISWTICGIVLLFCAGVVWAASSLTARRLAATDPAEGLARAR